MIKEGYSYKLFRIAIVVVDVTESPIERPKKNIHLFYSGKKKRHTLKSQVVVNQSTGKIICTAYGKGKEHNFRLFKKSKTRLRTNIKLLGDKGYQGIQKLHALSQTPKKKPRGDNLSIADKNRNWKLARIRVIGENVHRKLSRIQNLV